MFLFKALFVQSRFYYYFGSVVICFLLGFGYPFIFILGQIILLLGLGIVIYDLFFLFYTKDPIVSYRLTSKVFSLGNTGIVKVFIENKLPRKIILELLDELPFQLQKRDFIVKKKLNAKEKKVVTYELHPLERGVYNFGDILIFLLAPFQFFQRKITISAGKQIPIYPSLIDMKHHGLLSTNKINVNQGKKRIRRLGNNEFDHIQQYNIGDAPRLINWKASSRSGNIMVNKYEDEKSQNVYSILDLSRTMYTPFNGMSLIDYAINTSLAISNIVLKKRDKIGLISFSKNIHSCIKASNSPNQLRKILLALYKEKTIREEANFEKLYFYIRNNIKRRSFLLLFSNFESTHALQRNIQILRKLNKRHLLVVVFFKNEELEKYYNKDFKSTEELYFQTAAGRFVFEKQKILKTLQQFGIQTIFTKPKNLSTDTINKYLQIKTKGAI